MNIFFTIRRLICWFRGEPVPFFTVVVEETPDNAVGGILYLFRTSGEPWGLGFVCPCGCGELIELNLMPEVRPCWKVKMHWDSTPSLHPSVWRKVGCRSHFWLREGKVRWVR